MNKRYIDANELKQRIPKTWANSFQNCLNCRLLSTNEVLDVVNDMPTEDVQTVKHGHWEYPFEKDIAKCSKCGFFVQDKINSVSPMYKYCPYCGARMDGEVPPAVEEEKEGKQ